MSALGACFAGAAPWTNATMKSAVKPYALVVVDASSNLVSAQRKAADGSDISAWRSDTASTTLHNGTRAEYVVFDMGGIVTVGRR